MAEQLYLARKTVIEMLEDRNYKNNFVKNIAFSYFKEIYKKFDNYSGVFDLDANNEKGERTVVKFVKTINSKISHTNGIIETTDSTAGKKELKDLSEFIKEALTTDNDDTIIFIICYGDDLHEMHHTFEKNNRNVQIFHINRLIFNITKHHLVPKHEVLNTDEKIFIKKKLLLSNYEQLPIILTTDVIAKYHNMKHGDVCKIYRPSKNAGHHICYRYCKESVD
uniref:RNA polymerase subunit H/Rpb5 C-terminal domain-containing protein n=1 Tax=viral metagenome TaxID=1070528 RepID=A0A6C0IXS7_9ZZZZ